jgi:hypothetical protein
MLFLYPPRAPRRVNGHTYFVHGLHIYSEIELLGVSKNNFKLAKNILHIRKGTPEGVETSHSQGEGQWIFPDFLRLHQYGDYWVLEHVDRVRLYVNATEVWVEPLRDLEPEDLTIFILSSGLSTVLLLRGVFPLHTNVVVRDGCGIGFVGQPGAGKSTTTAYFVNQGCTLVADDVCSVRLTADSQAFAVPGYPFMKLWPDALERIGEDSESYPRVMSGVDKRRWSVEAFAAEDQPLKALFEVVRVPEGEALRLEAVSGTEAFQLIASNAFRGPVVLAMSKEKDHFRFCGDLAACVKVFRIFRPEGLDTLEDIYDLVQRQVGDI